MTAGGAGDLAADLAAQISDGILATGGQVYASLDGEPVIDVAVGVDGIGEPVRHDTLFAVYCAGKPVVAAAVGCLVDDKELSFDDVVGDVVETPLPAGLASRPIAQLMDHTAGLHGLRADTYMMTPAGRLDALVASVRPPPGWNPATDLAYSEVAAWHLLDHVIADLSGGSTRSFVRRRVLDPSGVGSDLYVGGMTGDEYVEQRPRLGVNVWLSGTDRHPMLMEHTRRLRCARNAAVSTTASARGLARFYEALLRVSGDDGFLSRDVLGRLVLPGPRRYDRVMDRECRYGLGFMVDLEDHHFGLRPGPGSFGHSGNGGMSVAFGDPEHGVAIAYHLNGRVDAESAILYQRRALVTRIYRSLLDAG